MDDIVDLRDTPFDPHDGTGPEADPNAADAARHHGGVVDTAHPDYRTVGHRYLPTPEDDAMNDARRLVIDDLEWRRGEVSGEASGEVSGEVSGDEPWPSAPEGGSRATRDDWG